LLRRFAPRNDVGKISRSRGAERPRSVKHHPSSRGAGNAGRALAPAASRAKKNNTRVQSPQVRRISRHSLRDGFNGFLRALPGDRAFLPPSLVNSSTNLAPASGRQNHTTSPSATAPLVLQHHQRPSPSAPRFVTIAIRPLGGAGWHALLLFLPIEKAKNFSPRGWTGGQISVAAPL
jgi:hypothetical protein